MGHRSLLRTWLRTIAWMGKHDSWIFESDKGRVEVPARIVVRYRTVAGVANAFAAGIGIAPLPTIYFSDIRSQACADADSSGGYPLRRPVLYADLRESQVHTAQVRTFIDWSLEYVAANARD